MYGFLVYKIAPLSLNQRTAVCGCVAKCSLWWVTKTRQFKVIRTCFEVLSLNQRELTILQAQREKKIPEKPYEEKKFLVS